jgi:hypothetical protein
MNWKALGESKHIVNVGFGWDHSLSYSIGYAYQFKFKKPLILNANFSIPSGDNLVDDFKTKIGGQLVVLNNENLKGSVSLHGIFRRYENPLVRLVNFGSEMKGVFGYYKTNYFVAGEFGFDKAIVTHFKHSELFKDNVYAEVTDGWHQPSTGGNFNYGIQTGYSFSRYDLTLNIGKVVTQDFKTAPLIPFYFMLGFNYKLK